MLGKYIDNKNEAPIAVFDSGVGGISVLRALIAEMPNENYWYYGDSANAPYGTKTLEEVRKLTISHVDHFIESGAKAVVVACNTATSAAVRILRQKYPDVPIIGIEPALKPAVLSKKHPNVIVMATPMTLRQEKFHNLMERYMGMAHIIPLPCPGLMEYIENGNTQSEELLQFIAKLFEPFELQKLDAVVLGCTHYPFISREIQKVLGDKVMLFEGGPGTARETKRRICEAGLLNPGEKPGKIVFENSEKTDSKEMLCKKLLNL
ncbi:MAG: glutamate racemase [Lachnospiraceae bacterium]|nr:glutamate racemase [Lachnospiraceae bacterium]